MNNSQQIINLYESEFRHSGWKVPQKIFSSEKLLSQIAQDDKAFIALLEYIRQYIQIKNPTFCILGAGSGTFGNCIRNMYPKSPIIEVDKNAYVIKRLQRMHKTDKNRIQRCESIEHMSMEPCSIDISIGYGIFRYIEDKECAVKTIQNTLRSKGMVCIADGIETRSLQQVKKITDSYKLDSTMRSIGNVSMPHLTFAYYLITKYNKTSTVTMLINNIIKQRSCSIIEAAFLLAGNSPGTLRCVHWRKR